jgi:DNA-binding NarL/FixJ family response regulator
MTKSSISAYTSRRHSTTILILKADRLYADLLRRQVLSLHPDVNCRVVHQMADAEQFLEAHPVDLFVTGLEALDGDTLDLVARFAGDTHRVRTLVVTRRAEPRLLAFLRNTPLGGVFDASTDEPENFLSALEAIMAGGRYLSANFRQPCNESRLKQQTIEVLTPTERLIFALIGDGSDDTTASTRLGMKPASIQAVRRSLHGKLRIKQRGELVNTAVQLGFVRFTALGATPVGLGLLLADYHARSQRPLALSPKLAAEYPSAARIAAKRLNHSSSE